MVQQQLEVLWTQLAPGGLLNGVRRRRQRDLPAQHKHSTRQRW
jgi:hypothetical protein